MACRPLDQAANKWNRLSAPAAPYDHSLIRLPALLLPVFLALAPTVARSQAVLYYVDFFPAQSTPHLGSQALDNLGVSYTTIQAGSSAITLAGALQSGNYAFVLIEAYSASMAGTDSAALVNYISSGGRAVVNYWDMDADSALQAALGVGVSGQDVTVPQTISIWDFNHPAVANVISALVPQGDFTWNDNGDSFTLLSGSVALAGYAPSPQDGSAAIVLANGGRTIVNGFLATDYQQGDMVALFSSQISTVSGIPEPSTLLLGLLGIGLLPLLRRRGRL